MVPGVLATLTIAALTWAAAQTLDLPARWLLMTVGGASALMSAAIIYVLVLSAEDRAALFASRRRPTGSEGAV